MRVRNYSPESPPLGAGLRKPPRFSRRNSYRRFSLLSVAMIDHDGLSIERSTSAVQRGSLQLPCRGTSSAAIRLRGSVYEKTSNHVYAVVDDRDFRRGATERRGGRTGAKI